MPQPHRVMVPNSTASRPTPSTMERLETAAGDALQRSLETPYRSPPDHWMWVLYVTILCGIAVMVYGTITRGAFQPLIALARRHEWTGLVLYPAALWTAMGTILLTFRTCVWMRYRPFPACSYPEAPRLTVVIPAYNEGAMVLQAIGSVANADYPRDRLEIVVVDDGSTDDTWHFICAAATRYPSLITTVQHPKNRGKREALAQGFARARGEIIVTLDSDSIIERGALLALAGPFREARIGAVAGKVVVYNRRGGLIPRMLQVRYILSFDLLRAAESAYGNVFCCPGALTAYRAAAVRCVLERWRGQTFLGSRCTFGEDRALTNFLLAAGYDTVYQRSAAVHTVVPTTYAKLCKMFIRWDRSYVREEFQFARIVWKRPLRTSLIALYDRLVTNLRFPVYYVSLALLLGHGLEHPWMLIRLLIAIGLVSFFNALYYLRSERSLDFLYGVAYSYFAAFTLFWIFPYALATVRARAWLTR